MSTQVEVNSTQATQEQQKLEQLCINTIRTLAMDAVQKANSGHPGTPMALAPLAFTLFDRYLRFNPRNPHWPGRDRFVLSNGHASMLLYATLYLTGYDLSLDDLKQFRQWKSKTPGHPEYGLTAGIETTTGPLGQGCGNSVGMAIAQRWLASRFGKDLFDYRIYTVCGDGCLMEGVSNEAASLAGHLGLNNLIWFYDNNHITIEGSTSLAFSDDVATRFMGWNWNVLHVSDVNELETLDVAIQAAQREIARPTLVIVNSHIGWGSPHRQDTKEAHGEALGEDEVRLTKEVYGWPPDAHFLVPDEAREYMGKAVDRGAALEKDWNARYSAWAKEHPDLDKMWQHMQNGTLPEGWDKDIPTFPADAKGIATRKSDSQVLNAVAKNVPWLLGGSADLYPSTFTLISGEADFERGSYGGRNFHFGIREHAMGAVLNGMALSKLRPYGATFLIFSDYMRPPIRLSALMDIPVIFIYTHDSIGLGEDGPTHQPIEQLMSLAGDSPAFGVPSGRRQRSGGDLARDHAYSTPAGPDGVHPARRANVRSHQVCFRGWSCERRLHHGRCRRRQAGGHPHGHRLRSAALRGSLRATYCRRRQGTRGLDAVLGAIRQAVAGIQEPGAAAGCSRARRRRSRHERRLEQVCWH